MSGTPMWRRYLRFWGPEVEADVRDELDFHIEMRTEELIEEGWAPHEAHREALRLFGDIREVGDTCRAIGKRRERARRRNDILNEIYHDLAHALRLLLKRPALTTVVVLSLALGIGANTAIFTLVKAVLLERLPVRNPEELVLFNWVEEPSRSPSFSISGWYRKLDSGLRRSTSFSYSGFRRFLEDERALSTVFAFAELHRLSVRLSGEAELSDGLVVSGDYFSGLGIRPHLGRLITREDDRAASDPVVVISNVYWRGRCGSDPAILGRTVRLNGNPFTIVGVTPASFTGTMQVGSSPSFYVPLAQQSRVMPRGNVLDDPTYWWLHLMGRLKPGVRIETAREVLALVLQGVVQEDLAADIGDSDGEKKYEYPQLQLTFGRQGMNEVRERLVEPLSIAQTIIGVILLIACVNVATLLLARSEERKREMAVRLSLGASRSRLTRQLLTESMLLALMGGALGLILAQWGSHALYSLLPISGGSLTSLRLEPDPAVVVFTLLVSLFTGLVSGLVPAFRTSGFAPGPSLKEGEPGLRGGGSSRLGVARTFVVVQVALSLVLLVAAGLMLRSLHNVESIDPGFDPEGVLVFKIDPTLNGYRGESLGRLYDDVLEELNVLPGVTNVSLMPHPLISGSGWWDDAQLPDGKEVPAYIAVVDAHFLETMRIPLLFGRNLSPRDDARAPRVALVNETFVRDAYGGDLPLGRRFNLSHRKDSPIEIVGVFRDSKDVSLKEDTQATVFFPYRQSTDDLRAMTFLLRSDQSPQSLIGEVRSAVGRVDPDLPLFEVKTLTDQIDESMLQERQFSRLSVLCGALALLLTSIGLYGTLSASVSRRTQEIGIRIALGARRADVLRSVMKEMSLVLLGIGLGLAAAWAVTRWLSSMLFQLTAMDPLTLSAATLLMLVVAGTAVIVPAHRASRVDPMTALRFE